MQTEPPAFFEALAAQRLASDPQGSVFVDANAGAGKTSVLTARVARLLLAGAAPAKILCITYTKAAAAEMAGRLLKLLGEWALAGDGALSGKLDELEGEGKRRTPQQLARARGLFARALETPGGLKIQTIHSFCESVLARFPLEAGAAPGFSVIDEREGRALAEAAAAAACADDRLSGAVRRLGAGLDPGALSGLIVGQILSRQKIDNALLAAGGFEALRRSCAPRFGVAEGAAGAAVRAAALARIEAEEIRRLVAVLSLGGAKSREAAEKLERYLSARTDATRFDALYEAMFTDAGTPRVHVPDKTLTAAHPWTERACDDLKSLLEEAALRAADADNCADTVAFLAVLEAALSVYERAKSARAGLDYDDLISKTRDLFRSDRAAWVRYKLDEGVDHILLDEGQDTSPAQWDVIEGPLTEFFAGAGAREAGRTFFAVGDKKQSIYSFQGADAALFQQKEHDLGAKISAVQAFRNVPLRLSFRSTAPVLSFVDALFADRDALEGVGADWPLRHTLRRVGEAGRVELWPLLRKADSEKARAWDAPLDSVGEDNPRRRLAVEIARRIRGRIGSERLLSEGRLLQPKDFLILVQSRAALFHEMIRALARLRVPVAGADRIRLLEEPAVEDVLSFARAVLLYSDDLSLAETLRGPFCDVSEDSLYELAHDREGRLRAALEARASERPEWARAAALIARVERVGREEGAFAFLSHLLDEGDPSGRNRLYARLSPSAEEPLNELLRQALDYERAHPRSLQGFLAWTERNAVEIRRDPEQGGDAVRVMTVHGAKGLEAPIVILLDAQRPPNLKHLGPLFYAGDRGAPFPVVSPSVDADGALAGAARQRGRREAYEEYRRLLYVAATRARDELIVCGVVHPNAKKNPGIGEKCWHALAEDAFVRLPAAERPDEALGGAVKVIESAQEKPPDRKDKRTEAEFDLAPRWLFEPAPKERRARLTPSSLGAGDFTAAYSPLRRAERLARGRALHRLIELLPEIEDSRRSEAADRLLAHLAPNVAQEERGQWREEALAVIRDPAFAPVFCETSVAEVGVAGAIATPSGPKFVSGKIDRLALEDGRLLVVDYKTNRPPPARIEDAPQSYLAQLAAYRALLKDIYPGARFEAALLWTYDARLMAAPEDLIESAFAALLAGA